MVECLFWIHCYFVLAYVVTWAIVHFTKFDCICEMTSPANRLFVLASGPLWPPFFIVVGLIGLPLLGLAALLEFVPPFIYLGHAAKWVMRKQKEQVAKAFRVQYKKDQLRYLNELEGAEKEVRKQCLRDRGDSYVLDEPDPIWTIEVAVESENNHCHILQQAAYMLGGTNFEFKKQNGWFQFDGTPTILRQLREYAANNHELQCAYGVIIRRVEPAAS